MTFVPIVVPLNSFKEIVMNDTSTTQELLDLTQKLLDAIANGHWPTYEALCAPGLTCFEPEAKGHLVEGLDFHKFYFDLGGSTGPRTTTIASPHVQVLGDAAIVTYIRLVQSLDDLGNPRTSHYEETRVWHKQNGKWQHVHFHRSPCPG